ncbi:MAG: sigma 54-interacting transcriptional regulator, partial [Rubrivivax sp.]|nr:sigma 54-interacting transcriptional regulator [Rubrivivax sp.]
MTPSDDRTLAHARAIRARGLAMPPEGLPSTVILDSWARCLETGLVPGTALTVPVVDNADLSHRREHSEFVRRLAQAELETLSRQIAGSNFLLAFADHDGVILDLYADNRFAMSGSDAGIQAGSVWSEAVAGTNGLGTALATGAPVQVTGMEHYFLKFGDISCTAAPVRDAQGRVVGVLDASSYYESRQRHTQALVQMGATQIENGLLAHQMRGQLVLAFHPRAEYLGTLSAGLLAFDGDGRLAALNGPGHSLLSGLDASRGTCFEELFCEPLEHVLARLHVQAEVRLRDSLGSALVARMVGRPVALQRRGGGADNVPHLARRPQVTQVTRVTRLSKLMQQVTQVTQVAHATTASHTSHPSQPSPALPASPIADSLHASRTSPASHSSPAQRRQHAPLRQAAASAPAFLAGDPGVAEACRLVEAAVALNVPILLQGETGTGKELLARHAHQASGRQGAFVAVNCAALPAELFEAELFGYTRGAYTGARHEGSPGLIVAADGGTLLLDEVCELPLPLQAALLRFIDDRSVRAVGSQSTRRVDVQLLAATHADLDAEVAARRFREDLLYRLNNVCATLPPLRARRDLPEAVHWVLRGIDARARIDDLALVRLARHAWPGNFRELRAVLTRALLQR